MTTQPTQSPRRPAKTGRQAPPAAKQSPKGAAGAPAATSGAAASTRAPMDWDSVYALWAEKMAQAKAPLSPLFMPVTVHDPAHPDDRPTERSWWPAGQVAELHKALQGHLNDHPGTHGPIHPDPRIRRSELTTLNYLAEVSGDPKRTAAVLIAASLFTRLYSRLHAYPTGRWPRRDAVERLYDLALKAWGTHWDKPWTAKSTAVLPGISIQAPRRTATMRELIEALAAEHARILKEYRPVAIQFKAHPDRRVEKALAAVPPVMAGDGAQTANELLRHAFDPLQDKVRQHEQWRALKPEVLEQLVWSRPLEDIGDQFGVPGSLVGRRCRKLGIQVPPIGFWVKVARGTLPHPHGVPQRETLAKELPKRREWRSLTRDELEKLVWQMPSSRIGELYGVSDKMVGKRCDTLGIPKPARGFWRKVEVGLLPDPKGVPQPEWTKEGAIGTVHINPRA